MMSNTNDGANKNNGLSRRSFIKIGAASLTISVVGGGLWKLLLPRRKKLAAIDASTEKPNMNPAFSAKRQIDGSLLCTTRLSGGKVLKHELNPVGAELYLACDGKHTRDDIVRLAAMQLGKEASTFAPDAKQFLVELEKQNLIVTTGKVKLFYNTMVRYERT